MTREEELVIIRRQIRSIEVLRDECETELDALRQKKNHLEASEMMNPLWDFIDSIDPTRKVHAVA